MTDENENKDKEVTAPPPVEASVPPIEEAIPPEPEVAQPIEVETTAVEENITYDNSDYSEDYSSEYNEDSYDENEAFSTHFSDRAPNLKGNKNNIIALAVVLVITGVVGGYFYISAQGEAVLAQPSVGFVARVKPVLNKVPSGHVSPLNMLANKKEMLKEKLASAGLASNNIDITVDKNKDDKKVMEVSLPSEAPKISSALTPPSADSLLSFDGKEVKPDAKKIVSAVSGVEDQAKLKAVTPIIDKNILPKF